MTYDGFGEGWIIDIEDPRLPTLWPKAFDVENVDFVLYVAKLQCIEFAPALAEDAAIPENYVAAQVLQARALVRAGIAGNGDDLEGVTVFPMDWTVKALLRPKRGKPYWGQP